MYRVMIVDDEILVRIGLKSTIDWEGIGFTVVAEAANGEQAFELFCIHKPDVVLTDIRMPKMDGLRLTELIKKESPRTKVLILSCYDEFSYAREALKLGASNYMLKSEIEDDELVELMKEIRAELDSEMGNLEKYSKLNNQINSNLNLLKEKLLIDLINNNYMMDDAFKSRCKSLDFDTEGRDFMLSILYKDNIDKGSTFSENDWKLLDFAIVNVVTESLNDNNCSFLICNKDNNFVVLMNKSFISERDMAGVIKKIKEAISQYLNISLSVMLSSRFKNITAIGEIYKECLRKFQMSFYYDKGCVITFDEYELTEINIVEVKEKYAKLLIDCVDEQNLQKSIELVFNMEQFFKDKKSYPMQVKLFYTNLICDVLDYFYNLLKIEDEVNEFTKCFDEILNTVRIYDVTRIIKLFVVKLINAVERCRINNPNNIIPKAIEYIKKHYNEEISLQSLADHLNLSKHYVCYVFKKETGENISVFVNKVRIENAKTLLKKFDYKVKEIYDKVGFADQQYFCKTFKKITGMTVAQYKESVAKKA